MPITPSSYHFYFRNGYAVRESTKGDLITVEVDDHGEWRIVTQNVSAKQAAEALSNYIARQTTIKIEPKRIPLNVDADHCGRCGVRMFRNGKLVPHIHYH